MRRIPPYLILLTIAMVAATADGAEPTASTRPAAAATWDSYSLIINRNIFMRNRSSQRPTPDFSQSYNRTTSSELVLAGVAVQESEQIAFFEDSGTGATTRAAVGQNVGGGNITAIRLEGIDITFGNTARTIAVGETLSGRHIELAPTSSPTMAPSPTGYPAASSGPMTAGQGEGVNMSAGGAIPSGSAFSGTSAGSTSPIATTTMTTQPGLFVAPGQAGPDLGDSGNNSGGDAASPDAVRRPSPAPSAANAGPMSIEERMRQQRLQEGK